MPASGTYGGQSAEQRTARRRERLLAAGLELIGTRGFQHTSVRGICREARLSTRFFYESFDDLDALAVAVFDEVVLEAGRTLVEAVARAPADDPHAQARAAVATVVTELTGDPRRARVAFVEALGSEPLTRRRLDGMRDLAAKGLPGTREQLIEGCAAGFVATVEGASRLGAARARR